MHEKAKKKIDMMKHALGWPDCYRNQYCAGEDDIKIWDELVEEGCAVKRDIEWTIGPIYQVTAIGMAVLQTIAISRFAFSVRAGLIENHKTDNQANAGDGIRRA